MESGSVIGETSSLFFGAKGFTHLPISSFLNDRFFEVFNPSSDKFQLFWGWWVLASFAWVAPSKKQQNLKSNCHTVSVLVKLHLKNSIKLKQLRFSLPFLPVFFKKKKKKLHSNLRFCRLLSPISSIICFKSSQEQPDIFSSNFRPHTKIQHRFRPPKKLTSWDNREKIM